jgi:hypothetical protein
MKHISKYSFQALLAAPLLLIALAAPANADQIDIQMLPPTDMLGNGSSPCTQEGVLFWDTRTTIRCLPGVTGDNAGNFTVGSGSVSAPNGSVNAGNSVVAGGAIVAGASISAGTTISAGSTIVGQNLSSSGKLYLQNLDLTNTLMNLATLNCPAGEAVSTSASGQYDCIAVADIQGIGKTVVPTCPSGQQIVFNGTAFSCRAIPFPAAPVVPVPPVCVGANALQFDGTNYQCVPIASLLPAAAAGGACTLVPAGNGTYQFYNGVALSTNFIGSIVPNGVSIPVIYSITGCAAQAECVNGTFYNLNTGTNDFSGLVGNICNQSSGASQSESAGGGG